MLGGIYSLFFEGFVLSPFSDPPPLWGLLPVDQTRSLDSTPSTIVFLMPVLISSFLSQSWRHLSRKLDYRISCTFTTCGSVSSRQQPTRIGMVWWETNDELVKFVQVLILTSFRRRNKEEWVLKLNLCKQEDTCTCSRTFQTLLAKPTSLRSRSKASPLLYRLWI
jgi:hypothetical protein